MFKDRFKPDPDDFITIILGPTGSGRTNFINKLTGNPERRAAGNLDSDTQDVIPYSISYQGFRLVLVDTPGFDDTYQPDGEILGVIADWLIQKYPDGTTLKIAGIIYLHRITDKRMSGPACKNLQMFGRLCGAGVLRRTCLVTTMWDLVKDQEAATQRESQLKNEFWNEMITGGATVQRFVNTSDSAWNIIHDLLNVRNDGEELFLQEELVDQHKHLNETEAGKVVSTRLQKLLAERRNLSRELEQAKLQNDLASSRSLEEEYEAIDARLLDIFEEIEEMKIPLFRRILLWLFRRRSRVKELN